MFKDFLSYQTWTFFWSGFRWSRVFRDKVSQISQLSNLSELVSERNRTEQLAPQWIFSRYLLSSVLMESQVRFSSSAKYSGASQQKKNSDSAFSWTAEIDEEPHFSRGNRIFTICIIWLKIIYVLNAWRSSQHIVMQESPKTSQKNPKLNGQRCNFHI